MTFCTRRNPDDSECTLRRTIAVVLNKILPIPCPSSPHSSHLLLHHHQSLFRELQKTQSTSMKGPRNPLSKSWTALSYSTERKAMKNSLSGAGQTPRLSTTGRGGSTGTWRDDAKTVARSATERDGVERAWRTTRRWGFGTWTNRGRFELAGGQCYEFHRLSGPIFFFHAFYLCFTHRFHCFTFIVSLWLELRLKGCAHQHEAWLSLFTHSL